MGCIRCINLAGEKATQVFVVKEVATNWMANKKICGMHAWPAGAVGGG
jgi:hypothetical protein